MAAFLIEVPWTSIVELRFVITFAFLASKNAEKYSVRAEGYLKPGNCLRFDVILIRQSH